MGDKNFLSSKQIKIDKLKYKKNRFTKRTILSKRKGKAAWEDINPANKTFHF